MEIELVEPIMEAGRFRKLAEVIMKYDTGLHLDDGSGNGENQAVLEVEMTGPCNECGEKVKGGSNDA